MPVPQPPYNPPVPLPAASGSVGTCVRALLFLLPLLCVRYLPAQRLDMKILGNRSQIEIPFDMENDFIVIPVLLNNLMPLRFIIDTGAENTVILDRKVTDLLDVDYRRTFEIRGADVENVLTAHLATGINLRLADRLLARNRTVLVLDENYFNFERITGTNIHGIIGGDFLMRFVVEFDFRRQIMRLHDPNAFRPKRKFVEVDATFIRNRPYLDLAIGVLQSEGSRRRVLLDTGAGLSLLMHTYSDTVSIDLPVQTVPAYIASGLGGTMEGSVGRSRSVRLGNQDLQDVVTYFQEVDTFAAQFMNQREGIVGTRLLKRFGLVIDYVRRKVYLQPDGRKWKRKFTYDRSGISLLAGGSNLRKYSVSSVIPDSPADRAGVQVRDRVRSINGISTSLLSLESIIRKLEGKAGKRVRLRIYRAGRLQDLTFVLEDLI